MTRRFLDLLGEVCPTPLIRTRQAFAALLPGDDLVVETDFARALRTICQWCSREGHAYEVIDPGDGIWRIIIRRN